MSTISPVATIACPRCKQDIPARLEQLIDVGTDPTIKHRFLSGNLNIVECKLCSFRGMAATPLVYHDPTKELLLTYTPVELNLPLHEKEQILGALTRSLISHIPTKERKGYLLQPKEIMAMDGLINAILEADGVTAEMIETQRSKTNLLQDLAAATENDLPNLIEENDEQIDELFFQLLAVLQRKSDEDKNSQMMLAFEKLEQQLLTYSTFGKETRQQIQSIQKAAKELDALGKNFTREKFVQLVTDADDEHHITSLITLARPAADYEFFIMLTAQIEKSTGEEQQRLINTRTIVLETVQNIDAAAEEKAKASTAVLQTLLTAEDPAAATKERLHEIDETLLMLLQNNIEAERKKDNLETVTQLEELRATIMQTIHESAPPEIQLVNELLSLETDEEAQTMLRRRVVELTDETLLAMKRAANQLRTSGKTTLADKLEAYHTMAEKEIAAAKWR